MKRLKNQVGITLIEVLATITILSIVSVVIYSIFSNGLRYSSQAEETVLLQQEANYVLTLLKKQHENMDSYKITIDDNNQKVTIDTVDTVNNITVFDSFVIDSDDFLYEISELDNENNIIDNASSLEGITISSLPGNKIKNFHIQITVKNKNNPGLNYSITTILSRL